MNNGKILHSISISLGFLGLLVACSLPPYRIIAIIVIIFAIILYIVYWVLTVPPWTIIEIHRIVNIKRVNGSLAIATKNIIIRANHKGLTEFLHRNIRADGSIQNFKLDSNVVPEPNIELRAGEYIVHERFKKEIKRFEKRRSSLTYELINSFPSTTESTGYLPDYSTRKYKIDIHLPKRKPARNPRAYVGLGAEHKDLQNPELSPDGCTISWEGKNLRPGKSYTIEWDW